MNRVIESLMVNNPCTKDDFSQRAAIDAVQDYSRGGEQQRSGRFELEEGIQAMLTSFDSSSKWTLDNIKELNQSLEQLIKSNNVRQNPSNTRSEAQQPMPQAQPGMVQPGMQPGIGQPVMGQMQPGMGVGQPVMGYQQQMGQPMAMGQQYQQQQQYSQQPYVQRRY